MTTTIKIPLLNDHHSHPLFYSAFGQAVSLQAVSTKSEATELIQGAVARATSELTVVHGWRSNYFQWSQEEIESLPPIAIFNLSLHSLLINRSGKQILHQRYGEVIDNLEDRTWYENNLRLILNWFANLYATAENLQLFYRQMQQQGVFTLEEMLLVDENEIDLFQQSGLLGRTKFWAAPETYESLSVSGKRNVTGLKLFTDGAIGSRTAAMSRPYVGGDRSDFGMLIYSDIELANKMSGCFESGKSLAIHAIGDRAIEQVIRSLELTGTDTSNASSVRIEHAQMITQNLAQRAKDLGVTLSMQPNFSSDSVEYSDRLDAQYCMTNNPFRLLIDECGFVPGDDLIFGSDGMPHGVQVAVNQSLFPVNETQTLTIDEFVAGYCLDNLTEGEIELEIDQNQRSVRCSIR